MFYLMPAGCKLLSGFASCLRKVKMIKSWYTLEVYIEKIHLLTSFQNYYLKAVLLMCNSFLLASVFFLVEQFQPSPTN